MPSKSQTQRAYLNMRFGHAWVKKHHFDNTGDLPGHATTRRKSPKGTLAQMLAKSKTTYAKK